ncbi:MAG: rRNA maturation RNase YbeY [Rhodocyclaceae bacterium]
MPKLELSLSVQYGCQDEQLPTRAQVRRWVRAAQEQPLQATVRFVDADEGQALNRTYRGKDYATNVLTFVYTSEPVVSGDLVICLPVVLREAAEQRKPFLAHLAHLVVHGMLHLQGYDHETGKSDAARMEARERKVLARFDIPDPYR